MASWPYYYTHYVINCLIRGALRACPAIGMADENLPNGCYSMEKYLNNTDGEDMVFLFTLDDII